MTDPILDLEIRLLVLRHGRRKVLESLATTSGISIEEVEDRLMELSSRERVVRKVAPPSAADLVKKAFVDRDEMAALAMSIMGAYESRAFLPQLRDVHRFLARHGNSGRAPKSRKDALRKVVAALGRMSDAELREIPVLGGSGGDSDYAVLAREIMGGASAGGLKQVDRGFFGRPLKDRYRGESEH